MNYENKYFIYLKSRSKLALFYRRFFLYKILDLYLKKSCLDVGCGIGDFIRFSKKCEHGVDTNKYAVEYCKELNLKVELILNNKFPYPSNFFQSIILDNVLEHIEDPSIILSEIQRVLSKECSLIIGVPGRKGYKNDEDHKIFYDDENIYNLLEKYGFKKKKVLRLPLPFKFFSDYLNVYCNYYIFEKI